MHISVDLIENLKIFQISEFKISLQNFKHNSVFNITNYYLRNAL